jgi:hypothetical protein
MGEHSYAIFTLHPLSALQWSDEYGSYVAHPGYLAYPSGKLFRCHEVSIPGTGERVLVAFRSLWGYCLADVAARTAEALGGLVVPVSADLRGCSEMTRIAELVEWMKEHPEEARKALSAAQGQGHV